MATYNIFGPGVRGVDAFSDPQVIVGRKFRHALNLTFSTGGVKTRPAMDFIKLQDGVFQGATMFDPSRGISHSQFGCGAKLAFAASGGVYVIGVNRDGVEGCPLRLKDPAEMTECGEVLDPCGAINLFGAENYLIVQAPGRNTKWWDGTDETLTTSKGMSGDPGREASFVNQPDQLVNSAGVGIFWNGRIHQQSGPAVAVGDLIHKRGHTTTDDILGMTEQAKPSCGPMLSTNSRLGQLVAIEGLPKMGTPNGEGELYGFYRNGVVSYNTFMFPRETRVAGDGEILTQGWGSKQMVTHVLNTVSATGRYAVGVLPKDLFFRSEFGVHFLSRTVGVETIHDEPSNSFSDEVNVILRQDDRDLLCSVSCAYWITGNRLFTTCGMTETGATGFAVYNKAWGFTEDDTPLPVWEGVWTPPNGLTVNRVFGETSTTPFSMVCSRDRVLHFGVTSPGTHDFDGEVTPIPWALMTGRFNFGTLLKKKALSGGRLLFRKNDSAAKVTILVRDDRGTWDKWGESQPGEGFQNLVLGDLPGVESLWFDFWVQGSGSCELVSFDVEIVDAGGSFEESVTYPTGDTGDPNYFTLHDHTGKV